MIFRRFFRILLLCGCGFAAAAQTLTPEHVIVLRPDAIEAENTAAIELQRYLYRISGVRHRLVEEPGSAPAIHIGWSPAVEASLGGLTPEEMATDRIIVKSVGDDLILTGARPRGSLYAVYTYLEDVLGVRWWTPDAEDVPRMAPVSFEALALDYTPVFDYREAYVRLLCDHPEWRARLKLNGMYSWYAQSGEELGGSRQYVGAMDGYGHTMYAILPPSTYFSQHPEWYGLFDGTRQCAYPNDQLCLTNPEMKQEFIRRVLQRIAANPGEILSVSQMDSKRGCQCGMCLESDAKYGSPAGTLLAFVNDVADAVKPVAPEMIVDTFAYLYTQTPPEGIVPRDNVQIRLCSYYCDFLRPLDDPFAPENRKFFADLEQWARIAPRLAIWNYSANFNNFLMPHPNLSTYGPNMALFAGNRVKSVFDQGDSYSHVGELQALRCWLAAKLLWKPDADAEALTQEFLNGYYLHVGPKIDAYRRLLETAMLRAGDILPCGSAGNRTADWLDYTTAMAADRLFREGLASISGNPELARRVLWARIPLDWAILCHYDTFRQIAQLRREPFDFPARPDYLRQLEALTRLTGTNNAGESEYLHTFVDELRQVENRKIPAPPAGVGNRAWLDLQESAFLLYAASGVRVVESAEASNGLMLEIDPVSQWSGKVTLPPDLPGCWRVVALLRYDGDTPDAERVGWCGIYDNINREELVARFVPAGNLRGGDFRGVDLGVYELRNGLTVFLGNVAASGKLYCDRVLLVAEPALPAGGIPAPAQALVAEDAAWIPDPDTATRLRDPDAADGSTLRMFSESGKVTARLPLAQLAGWKKGRYQVFLDLHCDGAEPVELTVETVDPATGTTLASAGVTVPGNRPGFQRVAVGRMDLQAGEMGIRTSGNKSFQRILLDRMLLVP